MVGRRASFADTRPSTIVPAGESAVADHARRLHCWEVAVARSVGGMGLRPAGDSSEARRVLEGDLDGSVEKLLGSHLCATDCLPWACHPASRYDVGLEEGCRQNVREAGR